MTKIETVAEQFESYRKHVIPSDATAVQVEECRRAFYMGGYAMLMNLAYNVTSDDRSEDAAADEMDALKAECEAFAATLGAEARLVVEPTVYNVRNEDIEELLRDIGHGIGAKMPSGWGFMLMLFSYGEGGSNFYISNANRVDMLQMLREFINRQTS